MQFHRRAAALLGLALLPATAGASTIYDCTMTSGSERGWIPPQLAILHDEAKATAKVSDPVILTFAGAPIDARITNLSDKRITFAWDLVVQDVAGNGTRMIYRASWSKTEKNLYVTAQSGNTNQGLQSRGGKCTLRPAP
jgi:hypothetical protein